MIHNNFKVVSQIEGEADIGQSQNTFLRQSDSGFIFGGLFVISLFLLFPFTYINAQTKRAFLVGISEYPKCDEDSWNNIHGANDIVLISNILKNQNFKIKTLTNHSATAQRIRKELKSFSKNCKYGDIVYLHFSCHGQPFEDIDGDEDDGWDEALVPFDAMKIYQNGKYTGENHITDDELNGYLRVIRKNVGPNGFVYVVIDACHAGTSYRGEEKDDSVIIRGTERGFSKTNRHYTPRIDKRGKIKIEKSDNMANICILEACRSYQVNNEIRVDGKFYGSLSYYVYKALQLAKLDKSIYWAECVVQFMNKDVRLVRQNPVLETSL